MDTQAHAAIEKVLALEGGYVNDPEDPGGETKFGISKRSYPDIDIEALTEEDAAEIYFRDWWCKYGYDQLRDEIAAKLLALAVNIGPKRAHKLLQTAVNETQVNPIAVDGVLGPMSRMVINRHPRPAHLLAEMRLSAIRYYLGLGKSRFLAGWIRRVLA